MQKTTEEITYFEEYRNAKTVTCRYQYAFGFTFGRTYDVAEVRVNRVQVNHADKFTGMKDEFCNFIDIYMFNDNGVLTNAAEPTDFSIESTY